MWRRPTIRRIMAMVLVSGLVLGCFVEASRIRRVQAGFRQQARQFAELEKLERLKASTCLETALVRLRLRPARKALTSNRRNPQTLKK
jgi:hypothetical protein